MKISRKGFLKGVAGSSIGGLLLSREQALESALVSTEQKRAIMVQPRSMDHVIHRALGDDCEYIFWQGRLYLVTTWCRTLRTKVEWGQDDLVRSRPIEELEIGALLIEETG